MMITRIFFLSVFLVLSTLLSCQKDINPEVSGNAAWVKVISDAPVFFTGKIRADSNNNLLCSYNYRDYAVDSNSAIIALDANGKILGKQEFTNLTIYDFTINSAGELMIASCSVQQITLTKLSSINDAPVLLGSFSLPPNVGTFVGVAGMKIFTTSDGNYNITGTVYYAMPGQRIGLGFMIKATSTGAQLHFKTYKFVSNTAVATITGCAEAPDGTFRIFGNNQDRNPFVSSYFIMKCSEDGDSMWIKYFTTSWFDPDTTPSYSGYYCNTSDIIASGDGNFYACAFNDKYNLPNIINAVYTDDDNSARIFKINIDGQLLDSTHIDYDFQNMVSDLILMADKNLMIAFNPLGDPGGGYYEGKQNSYVAILTPDLTILSTEKVQNEYSDYLGSICRMPDEHIAMETMIQSFGKGNYWLQVLKTDKNGKF